MRSRRSRTSRQLPIHEGAYFFLIGLAALGSIRATSSLKRHIGSR